MSERLQVGFLLFPDVTQLDLTGPHEVLTRLPNTTVHLIAKTLEPVRAQSGMVIAPTVAYGDCPQLDLLCVPGGPGVNRLMEDEDTLSFVRRMAHTARYATSVCTGALVLGAAGLLRGRRAATHWASRDLLRAFGAEPVAERVVTDGKFITGGGVTAGLDFALQVAAEIAGAEVARLIQLSLEYDPAPPFQAGSPEGAGPELVREYVRVAAARDPDREAVAARAAARLNR